jgi:tetratricopeptide (TPR) repeat protein
MNAPTDWVSAIAILSAGLIVGLLFVIFFNRKKSARRLGGEKDLAYKDLNAKRDALVQQLRDLDENASPEERRRLERETAEVLRQLDDRRGGDLVMEPVQAAPVSTMNPALKGFLWGAGSFAALGLLGYMVMQAANPRQDGGSVTGGEPSAMQAQAAQRPDPVIQQLEAAVQADPNNLALRNDLSQAYLERDNLMAVFEQTKFVLDKSPEDSRALTYQGLVRVAMGEGELAGKMLERATKSDPKNLDSWVARAWLYAQGDDMKKAESMIAEAAKQSPEDKARLDEVFTQMKAHVAQMKADPTMQSNELPQGHPPIDGATPAAASAAAAPAGQMGQTRPAPPADGKSVKVTLSLDPAAKLKGGVLYVMARPAAGGPPVAVKRMQVSSFPITFDFGSADSMMGQPLPEQFRLEARLDSDGDAATKPPTDPSAMQMNVAPGAQIKLALK